MCAIEPFYCAKECFGIHSLSLHPNSTSAPAFNPVGSIWIHEEFLFVQNLDCLKVLPLTFTNKLPPTRFSLVFMIGLPRVTLTSRNEGFKFYPAIVLIQLAAEGEEEVIGYPDLGSSFMIHGTPQMQGFYIITIETLVFIVSQNT